MIKNALILLVFIQTIVASAQIPKGTYLFGGRVGGGLENREGNNLKNKGFEVSLYPEVGYFFFTNWAVGLMGGYTYAKNEITYPISTSSTRIRQWNTDYSINPFIRKYFVLGEKAAFFIQLSASYGINEREEEQISTTGINNENTEYENIQTGLTPGFAYFVSDKFAVETTMGFLGYYQLKNRSGNYKNDTYHFRLDLDLSRINIGVKYYLRKKQS